jgi:hypothetical protein
MRVFTAVELADLQVAVDLGPRMDVSVLSVERRMRHQIEIAPRVQRLEPPPRSAGDLLDADATRRSKSGTTSSAVIGMRWIRQERAKLSHRLAGLANGCTSSEHVPVGVSVANYLLGRSRAHVAAGVLFFDDAGRILLAQSTHRITGTFPATMSKPERHPRCRWLIETS